MAVDLNINETVEVTLNELGVATRNQYYDDLYVSNPKLRLAVPVLNAGDKLRDSLWSIANLFGPDLVIGFNPPFEPTISLVGNRGREISELLAAVASTLEKAGPDELPGLRTAYEAVVDY